jgi:hypothetical protein
VRKKREERVGNPETSEDDVETEADRHLVARRVQVGLGDS